MKDCLIDEKLIEATFKLALLRGEVLYFYCQKCRAEVTDDTHPQAGKQLIDFFNKSCGQRLRISQGQLKPYLVAKETVA